MKSSQVSRPTFFERLVAVLNYATFGLAGFVYLILVAFKKFRLTPFLQYHIFQTFFLVILCWLLQVIISLVVQILSFIPFLNILVLKLLFYFNAPIFFNTYSIVSGFKWLVLIYLCATSYMGAYSFIPWVSNIIGANIRR